MSGDVFRAILAEKVERYELVLRALLDAREEALPLLAEELELLCIAHKHLVDRERGAVQALRALGGEGGPLAAHYAGEVARRGVARCTAFLALLERSLSDIDADDHDAFIQRKKTIADYHRYVCELQSDGHALAASAKADYLYRELLKLADERLDGLSTLYLTVCVNYAVFAYEVRGERQRALAFLSERFERALGELNAAKEETVKDAMALLTYMDDNIKDWTREARDK